LQKEGEMRTFLTGILLRFGLPVSNAEESATPGALPRNGARERGEGGSIAEGAIRSTQSDRRSPILKRKIEADCVSFIMAVPALFLSDPNFPFLKKQRPKISCQCPHRSFNIKSALHQDGANNASKTSGECLCLNDFVTYIFITLNNWFSQKMSMVIVPVHGTYWLEQKIFSTVIKNVTDICSKLTLTVACRYPYTEVYG